MISHKSLAVLCQAMYRNNPADWDRFFTFDDVFVATKGDIVVFRGSQSAEDWLRDFDDVPVDHPIFGHVHAGFVAGMDDVYRELVPLATSARVITGHSLGAARAWLFAGFLAAAGRPAQQITVFGSPRPGFARLRDIIVAGGSSNASYRNGDDPVTEVPWLLGAYVRPVELTAIGISRTPFEDHHIEYYVEGVPA